MKSNPVFSKLAMVLHILFAGNIGLGREDLWTNLSLEYGGMNETDRSVQRDDAAALIDAGNIDVADPAQPWGHPIIRNDIKLFANYGASMTDDIKFYGHANYAQKEVEGGFYFRNPNTRGAVFSNDDGATLLVGDLRGLTAEMAEWEARKAAVGSPKRQQWKPAKNLMKCRLTMLTIFR